MRGTDRSCVTFRQAPSERDSRFFARIYPFINETLVDEAPRKCRRSLQDTSDATSQHLLGDTSRMSDESPSVLSNSWGLFYHFIRSGNFKTRLRDPEALTAQLMPYRSRVY